MFYLITTYDWIRMTLLYSHLVLCALAISAVLRADLSIIFGKLSQTEIRTTANNISNILLALWVTGLTIIYLDTGFGPDALLQKSKLLLKLTCVVTLTLNGIALHHLSFPLLTRNTSDLTLKQSIILVTTGALSTSHWMLAAFVGMSKPLARVPFQTLLTAYALFVLSVLAASLLFIPFASRVLVSQRA